MLACSVSTFVSSAKRQRKTRYDNVLCAAKRQDNGEGSSKLSGEKHAYTAGQGSSRELVNTRAGLSLLYCIDTQD